MKRKTEAQRKKTHLKKFGTKTLPKRKHKNQ